MISIKFEKNQIKILFREFDLTNLQFIYHLKKSHVLQEIVEIIKSLANFPDRQIHAKFSC